MEFDYKEAFNELIIDADGDLQAMLDALCDGEYLKRKGYTQEQAEELFVQISTGLAGMIQEAHTNQT